MSEKHICAITVPFPGAKRPLEEGQKLGWWNLHMLDGKPKNLLCIPEADVYLFGAFHPIYAEIIPLLKAEGKKVMILWTSSIGEVDFCPPEQAYLPILLRDSDIDQIWFGDEGFGEAYSEKGFFAWYPLDIRQYAYMKLEAERSKFEKAKKEKIWTLFCPTGPKKNILTQLVAIKLLQEAFPGFMLHTNIEGYDWILDEIEHVRHPWLAAVEYQRLISSARVNFAVSHCETFNYQVAEALLWGTPSVIGPTVPLPGERVDYPSSALMIREAASRVLLDTASEGSSYTLALQSAIIGLASMRNQMTWDTLQKKV